MDFLSFLAAAPKLALFLLLAVAGVVAFEVFYFAKKRAQKTPEVSLPPSETLPPTEPAGTTPQVTSPPAAKRRLSKKALVTLLVVLFLALSLPAAVFLVSERQEVREEAAGEQYPPGCCYNTDLGNYKECRNFEGTDIQQPCNIPNGACGPGGKSCNPDQSGLTHQECRDNKCVFVPGPGEKNCPNNCQTQEPTCSNPPGVEGQKWYDCQNKRGPCAADAGVGVPKICKNSQWEVIDPPGTAGECTTQCKPGETGVKLSCTANRGGMSVKNTGSSQVKDFVILWFAVKCPGDFSGFCGGPENKETVTLGPGKEISKAGVPGSFCGSWQTDIVAKPPDCGSDLGNTQGCEYCRAADHGVDRSACGTPPPNTARCEYCKAYTQDWVEVDPNTLGVGQAVYFATRGVTTHPQGITKARFKINGGADSSWCSGSGFSIVDNWCQTTNRHGQEFYVQYTVTAEGDYTVESMVFNPDLGWW